MACLGGGAYRVVTGRVLIGCLMGGVHTVVIWGGWLSVYLGEDSGASEKGDTWCLWEDGMSCLLVGWYRVSLGV